jgi:3-oxoacyl-[acyl-carrier protein] reductase
VLHAPLAGLAEELRGIGAAVEVVSAEETPLNGPGSDATPEGAQAMVDRALARFGRLDAASLWPFRAGDARPHNVALLDASAQQIALLGGYMEATSNLLRAVIPAMRGRGGQIVVYTSDCGAKPEAGWSLYGAARAGQNFLIRAVALEHAAEGICLNAVGSKNAAFADFPLCPPGCATDDSVTLGDWSAHLVAETPLGRLGTMEELAAFAAVLLDGSNRFQTAQFFSYSGGWSSS